MQAPDLAAALSELQACAVRLQKVTDAMQLVLDLPASSEAAQALGSGVLVLRAESHKLVEQLRLATDAVVEQLQRARDG